MKEYLLTTGVGLLAQGFFSLRMLHQWVKTERARKIVSPSLFWVFSLCGSCLLLLVTLPPSNMMLQGVMGMAVCMIFVSRLTYRPGDDKNATRQSSRLRDMLARAKK